MTTALIPWRSRIETSIAKSRSIRGGNYVQLATVDASGKPKVRTVVFRGFAHDYDMKFITDARSEKYDQSSECELCWWFAKSSEQYRVSGSLRYVGSNESDPNLRSLRKQQWGNLSDKAREQFFYSSAPKSSFTEQNDTIPTGGRDENGKVLEPPDVFLLVLLQPVSVDYLSLSDNYRQLDSLATSDDSMKEVSSSSPSPWQSERVVP